MALQRRILRGWWRRQSGGGFQERSLTLTQTEALTALVGAAASARCNLPGGWTAQAGWTHLHLISPEAVQPLVETPLEACPLVEIIGAAGETGDGRTSQAIPQSALTGLVVRSRRAGDWIRPFGSSGRQSLQDYLVNRRVDAPFRDRVPLLCRGSEVLLAGGVGAGDIPRLNTNEDSVLLKWMTDFPWHRG